MKGSFALKNFAKNQLILSLESLSMILNEYLPYKRKEQLRAKIPEFANKQLGIEPKPEIELKPDENHSENSL